MDYLEIAQKYFYNNLIFDILGILPFVIRAIFMKSPIWVYILGDCLIFTKSVLLVKKLKILYEIFTIKENLQHWMELMKLMAFILFLSHILAIIYHGLA